MITKFQIFINENLKDVLKGKSSEEVDTVIKNLGLDNEELIEYIFENRLPFDILPRNKDGRCIYDEWLDLSDRYNIELPENFTINGNFNCNNCDILRLPNGLIVNGDFDCSDNNITEIPDDIIVNGNEFNCENNHLLTFPMELDVSANIFCDNNQMVDLPENFTTKASFFCNINELRGLPDGMTIGGDFSCYDNLLIDLPKRIKIDGSFVCFNNEIILELPDDAVVGGKFVNRTIMDKGYVQENITSFLKPKVEEEIMKKFKKIKIFKQFNENVKNLLTGISDEESLELLKGLDDNKKIWTIINFQLNFDLLPRDENGICHYTGDKLDLGHNYRLNMDSLPDNLTVDGHLDLSYSSVKNLSKGLVVGKDLYLDGCRFSVLPGDLKIGEDLWLTDTDITELPDGIEIGGNVYIWGKNLIYSDKVKIGGKVIDPD